MSEESRPKTAFITHMGLFEYNRMPFGLAGAPLIFQDLMNNVLQGLLYDSVWAYLDDVIVYSKTIEDHLIHVEQVFLRFRKAGLKLKLSKCEFFMKQLQFLGHVISERGIQPDFDKVKVICEMPPLCCVRDVRAFIGMCGYYRRYIPNFAHIAAPLIALTRKNARFYWTGESGKAFAMLKSRLTEAPILIHPVHDRPYRLYTDASEYAVGAILAQLDENDEERVVHYLSQQLNHTQRKWAVIEKEAWALVVALKKFRQYLLGAQFVVYTDHKPLRSLFTSEMKNARIQRWGILISEFNCEIKYREGKSMKADFVSRIRGPTITGDGMSEPPSGIGSGAQAGEGSSEAVDNGATSHLCSFDAGNASGGSPLGDPNEGMKELGCDLPTDPVKRVRGFGEVDGQGRQEVKRRRIQVIENSPETPPKENGKAGLVYSFLSFLGWRSWECYWYFFRGWIWDFAYTMSRMIILISGTTGISNFPYPVLYMFYFCLVWW